jgi:peptidoglycan/LPS O-acetylase OafA/YrhL
MIPNLLGSRLIDGVYWSLVPEIFFYVFMLILFVLRQLKNIEYVGFFWLFIMLVVGQFDSEKYGSLITVLNLKYGMLFLMGINFYKIYMKQDNWINHLQIFCCAITAFCINQKFEYLILIILLTIVFYLFAYGNLFFARIRTILFLGKISYSLYLIHQFAGYIIIDNLINQGYKNFYILIIVPFLISVGISFLIFKYIEVPSNKVLRNIYKNKISKFERSFG